MSLLPFLLITLGGSVLTWFVRRSPRLSGGIAGILLVGAILAALAISPEQTLAMGGSGLVTTAYLRVIVVLATALAAMLTLLATIDGRHASGTPITLGILGLAGLTLALPDTAIAVVAATAGGAAGALYAVGTGSGRIGATVGTRALRAAVIAGTMAIAASAWIGRDLSELAAQPVVFGLAYLAMGLAVAIRFGAIPFHVWTAKLTDTVAATSLPLVMVIGPAVFAVVALAWTDASIAPLLVDLDSARAVVIAVAVASILLGSLAAWIRDDLEHVVAYTIIGDAGVVLLGMAALDPAAWEPTRIWILVLVASRGAFAAWAGTIRVQEGTSRIDDLRGWALRTPLAGVALALTAIAAIGLPGLAGFEARSNIIALALDGPLGTIVFLGALTPLAIYVRLLIIGVERGAGATDAVSRRLVLTSPRAGELRAWMATTWGANRHIVVGTTSVAAAVLALGVSLGGLGGPAAAAGEPPTLAVPGETFIPGDQVEPDGPAEPETSDDPDVSAPPDVTYSPSASTQRSTSRS